MVGLFLGAEARKIGGFLCYGWSNRHSLHRRAEGVAFQSCVQIVVLCGTVINAKSGANNGLSVKRSGSPSQANARVEVLVIRIVQSGVCRTRRCIYRNDKGSIERTAPKARAMKLIQIKDRCPVSSFGSHAIVFPAQACGDRESWSHLPFILKVGHVEAAAKTVAAPGRDEIEVRKRAGDRAQIVCEVEIVIRRLTLVETDAANFHTHLESVAIVSPGQVVDDTVGGADFNVRRFV